MRAIEQYGFVLLAIHVIWLYAFLCGTLVRTPRFGSALVNKGSSAAALLDVVVCTAVGLAITGFVGFAAGLVGLLQPIGLGVWIFALALLFAACRDPLWRVGFWKSRITVVRAAVSPGACIIYVFAVATGFLIALPDLGSDATTGYLVYASDWARSHFLSVDTSLRFPYYAVNWVLLDTWLAVLGRTDVAAGLSWLAGLLSLLGVYGYVLLNGEMSEQEKPRWSTVGLALMAAATVALSPVFQRWSINAMVDVPIGFMFLACALSASTTVRSRGRLGVPEFIICGAFFLGMKTSLIVFAPLFIAAVVLAMVWGMHSRRRIVVAVFSLFVLSSPWYVRNFIETGDPITPVLNLGIRGTDPQISRADEQLLVGDLHSHEGGAVARLTVPIDIVIHTRDWQFRDVGVTWLLLGLIAPGAIASYWIVRRRNLGESTVDAALASFVWYAIGYWFLSSYMARYTLEFYAVLAACIGGTLAFGSRRSRWGRIVAVAVVAVLALPSPGSAAFFDQMWDIQTDFYRNYNGSLESWLIPRGPAYPEVEYVTSLLQNTNHTELKVYRYRIETDHLFWAQRGISVLGDAVGPGRYSDFEAAIDSNTIGAYINHFQIGAFVMPTGDPEHTARLEQRLSSELGPLSFREVTLPNQAYVMYIRGDLFQK